MRKTMLGNSIYMDKPKVQPLVAQIQPMVGAITKVVREIKAGNNDRQ